MRLLVPSWDVDSLVELPDPVKQERLDSRWRVHAGQIGDMLGTIASCMEYIVVEFVLPLCVCVASAIWQETKKQRDGARG